VTEVENARAELVRLRQSQRILRTQFEHTSAQLRPRAGCQLADLGSEP
jgi:hypothetical protein